MHRIGLLIAILHTLVSDEQHLRQQWADTFFESVCAQLADNLDDAKYVHAAICAGSWDANNRPVWMWLAGRSSELFGSGSIADFLRDFMKQPEWSSLSDGARQEFCAGVASVCMQPESSLDVVSGRMTLPGDVYKSVVHPAPG